MSQQTVNIRNTELNLRPISGKAGLITITTAAKGYADMTIPAGGTAQTMDDNCTHVLVNLENGEMRERGDGTAPTAAIGIIRVDGYTDVLHVNDFKARKWIRETGAAANGLLWCQQMTAG